MLALSSTHPICSELSNKPFSPEHQKSSCCHQEGLIPIPNTPSNLEKDVFFVWWHLNQIVEVFFRVSVYIINAEWHHHIGGWGGCNDGDNATRLFSKIRRQIKVRVALVWSGNALRLWWCPLLGVYLYFSLSYLVADWTYWVIVSITITMLLSWWWMTIHLAGPCGNRF